MQIHSSLIYDQHFLFLWLPKYALNQSSPQGSILNPAQQQHQSTPAASTSPSISYLQKKAPEPLATCDFIGILPYSDPVGPSTIGLSTPMELVANISTISSLNSSQSNDNGLFQLCWRRQSCSYCLAGDVACSWCAIVSQLHA